MQKGFTLIELMVTLVVLGILLGLGVPSYVEWIRDSRMDNATRSLAGVLKQARSEAVSRQNVITVQSGTNNNPGSWADGAHIYTDAQPAGNTDYAAATDVLVKNIDLNMEGVTIITNNDNNFISFTNTGRLNEAGIVPPLTVRLCDDRGDPDGTLISVNIVGRISIGAAVGCP